MKLVNVLQVLRKDLSLGPRSPLVLYAFVLPVIMTILIRGVFGSLFDPDPRLGIVDEGTSVVTTAALELKGIEVSILEDRDALLTRVEANDLDAGLILQPGFDAAVRSGDRPELQLFVGGESLASNRIVIAVAALDLVRGLAGETPPVEVEVVSLGDEAPLEISARLIPLIVIYAVALAGAMVPAASLVDEKEKRTIDALLVTPLNVNDVMAAKAAFGVILATATGVITLALNGGFGSAALATLVAIAVAGVMMAEIGLILGAWAEDENTLFTAFKGGGLLLFYPVIFYIWPDLPTWIAQLGPTYYFLQPIFDLAVNDASFGDVLPEIAVALAICAALVPAVVAMGKRMERRLGTGKVAKPAKKLVGAAE